MFFYKLTPAQFLKKTFSKPFITHFTTLKISVTLVASQANYSCVASFAFALFFHFQDRASSYLNDVQIFVFICNISNSNSHVRSCYLYVSTTFGRKGQTLQRCRRTANKLSHHALKSAKNFIFWEVALFFSNTKRN